MNETIKRRLAILEGKYLPSGVILRVTLPDGKTADVPARDWWTHRYEWDWDFPRGDCIAKDDPNGWPPFLLFVAKGFDKAYRDAMANGGRVQYVDTVIDENGRPKDIEKTVDAEYYKNERDEMLKKFFGEVIE